MDKRIVFSTTDSLGHHFAEALDITPRGGGLVKVAGALQPAIAAYVKDLRPDPKYQFVLMTPMGSFEFWGANVNGDAFPEGILRYDWTKDDPLPVVQGLVQQYLTPFGVELPPGNYKEFGYKTFLNAKRYLHHVNKDETIAYGDIVAAAWNPTMHRVELIVRHDREKAKLVGAEDVIKDIDEGRPRQISMGCKTPFDWCNICGKISRLTTDYCDHLKFQMGATLPDGRVVCAINPFPRFFDLSDVIIQAAKESGVLTKVASARTGMAKAATQKTAAIEKVVAPNVTMGNKLSAMSEGESLLPMKALMDRATDPALLLATLAALGIVARPEEFQYAVLRRMGKEKTADDLWASGQVFASVPDTFGAGLDPDQYSPELARALAPMLAERSAFYPHLPARIVKTAAAKTAAPPTRAVEVTAPWLEKIAQAYAAYRGSLRALPSFVEKTAAADEAFYNRYFFGALLTDALTKTASAQHTAESTLVPLYVCSAHRAGVPSAASWGYSVAPHSPVSALFGSTS